MINRILCQVALSFLLGILLALSKSNWIIFIVFACVFNCCISRKDNYSKKKKVIFFGIRLILHITCSLLGYSRYEHQETKYQIFNARIENEKQITITGKIAKKEIKNDQIIYYLKNATTQIQNRLITCQEALIYDDTEQYPIGTNIQVEGDIRPFRRAANQGNFHEQNFYKSKNIWLALNADQIISLNPIKPTITEQLWQLKKKIHKVYAKHLPEEQAGVLSMMTIGEKSLLDPEIKSLYQRSGISHILAISGLHISLIGTGLFRILRKTGLPIPFACTIAIIFVYCFGIMSGMEVSTTRAVIMFLLQISAIAFRYSYDSITALSVSMVIQLFINPFGIVYAGFLFSYAAVLGVTTVVRVMEQFRHGNTKKGSGEKKLLRMVTSTLFVSLGIQFATLPLSIYFYYEFPVYSVLINAILLPLMGVLLPVGLIGGVLGIMRNGGLILVQIAGWMLEFNEFICNLFQQLPKAVYITGQPPMWILSSYYLLLLLILWIMDQLKETEQDRWKKSLIQMMPMLLLIGLIVYKRPDDFEVTFLDVGQGDGIHIATEEGKNFFIDGGSSNIMGVGEYRILPYLKSKGIQQVDGWFVSHADADHISGLKEIIADDFPIEHLIVSAEMIKDEEYKEIIAAAVSRNIKIVSLARADHVKTKEITFTNIQSSPEAGADRNAASLVLLLEYGNFRAFFGGDISSKQEQQLLFEKIKPITLYKAGHHGSAGSNSIELLQSLKPLVSVVSCSEQNNYGHPAQEAIERIEQSGSKIYYTMKNGQITIQYKKQSLWIKKGD